MDVTTGGIDLSGLSTFSPDSLFPLVARGLFDEALSYRLNVALARV